MPFLKLDIFRTPANNPLTILQESNKLAENKNMVLGIDVGGTTIKCGVVDALGNISTVEKFATEEHTHSAQEFIDLIQSVASKHNIKGIGIGFPGQLSADRKTVLELTNIPSLNGCRVHDLLEKTFPDLRIALENDARCAAMAEYRFGKYEQNNFLLITLGTGVGGGFIINGELFKGGNGNAGEVGMIPVGEGKYLEDYIGQKQIVAYAETLLKEKDLSVLSLYNRAKTGDSGAIKVFKYVGNLLGEAIISMIHLYDIHTIIIGGGVGSSFDVLEPFVMEILNKRLSPYYLNDFKLLPASHQNDTGIIGAASLVK
jgi:glucokinase